jgi:hypothetical protein
MPRSTAKRTEVEDRGLWQSELGRYLREGAEGAPSIEEVREVLAAVTEPLARRVEAERDDSER